MIRINILPRKVTKKKLTIIRHLVLSGLVLTLILIGLAYWWSALNQKVKDLQAKVVKSQQEKESLKNVNTEKEQYEKSILELKNKIDVISDIQKGRYVPVHILDELTRLLDGSVPVWITRLQYDGKTVQLDGVSFTNPDIARFAQRLEESPNFEAVDLLFSQKSSGGEKEVFNFSINAQVETPKPPQPPQEKKP